MNAFSRTQNVTALALIVALGCACTKPSSDHPQLTQKPLTTETHQALSVENISRAELVTFLERHPHSKARIIYEKGQIYEVDGLTENEVKTALPQAKVRPNRYLKFYSQPRFLPSPADLPTSPLTGMTPPLFRLDECSFQGNPPTSEIEASPIQVRDLDRQVLRASPGELKFDGTASRASHSEPDQTLQYYWLLNTPNDSIWAGYISGAPILQFTPDVPGRYGLVLVVRDSLGECAALDVTFGITANAPYVGPADPRARTDADRILFKYLDQIETESTWTRSQGEGVVIAVVDSGVNYNHPDLRKNIQVNTAEVAGNNLDDDNNGLIDDSYGWDFAMNDSMPFDDLGHGTHVAGFAAGAINGVAPKAKILAIKALNAMGGNDSTSIMAAIMYAVDQNADVINLSFGTPGHDGFFEDAINYAESKGVLVVGASGNGNYLGQGTDVDDEFDSPASMENENLLIVAAVNDRNELTSYSNYGVINVDVAAPGGVKENGLMSTNYLWERNMYLAQSGTSMAAPIVAGLAALLKKIGPQKTNLQIKQLIMDSVTPFPVLATKVRTGGVVNVRAASALMP